MNKSQKTFRLKSITLENSKDFEGGHFQFFQKSDNSKNKYPFTTLIIGPNGTGKSRLLKVIIDIFNDLFNRKENESYKFKFKNFYNLEFLIGGDSFEIKNTPRELIIKRNGKEVQTIEQLMLPTKGVAAAYSLFEKFNPKVVSVSQILPRNVRYNNDFYEYLGIKTNNNFAFSSAPINNAIDHVTAAIFEGHIKREIESVFQILGFLPKISIVYKVKKNKDLFSDDVSLETVKEYLQNVSYRKAGFSLFSLTHLKEFTNENQMKRFVSLLRRASKSLNDKLEAKVELFFDERKNDSFEDFYPLITSLREYNLINYEKITVYKKFKNANNGIEIDLSSMSSGEIQVLTSLLSLASVVKDGSLILIDEPEISLHPNWQMKYIDLLNQIFKTFKSCHFLIATHSHLLASDILPDSSAILSLTRDTNGDLVSNLLDSTFGDSAENILYNVFGVATVRNYYFESDINRLLFLISSKSKKKTEIEKLISKFKKFKIEPNDPLTVIISDAEKYLKKQ